MPLDLRYNALSIALFPRPDQALIPFDIALIQYHFAFFAKGISSGDAAPYLNEVARARKGAPTGVRNAAWYLLCYRRFWNLSSSIILPLNLTLFVMINACVDTVLLKTAR